MNKILIFFQCHTHIRSAIGTRLSGHAASTVASCHIVILIDVHLLGCFAAHAKKLDHGFLSAGVNYFFYNYYRQKKWHRL